MEVTRSNDLMIPSSRQLSPVRKLDYVLIAACILLVRIVVSRCIHVYDDAFITFRYAHNLAEGLGFVYNPGASWEPVLGTTTPGYAIVLSLFERWGIDAQTAAQWLNRVCDVISGLLLIRFCGAGRLRALIIGFGWALMPELARISVGGMEAPLLLTLTLCALAALHSQRLSLAGVLVACACLVRPEAVLLVVLIAVELRRSKEGFTRFLIPVGVIGIASTLILTNYFGDPIPNSVRTKAARHSASNWLDTYKEIASQAFLPRIQYLPAFLLALVGLPRILLLSGPMRTLARFGMVMVAAYLLARPHTWGWYYYVPLTVWIVGVGFGLDALLVYIKAPTKALCKVLTPTMVLALLLLVGAVIWLPSRDGVKHKVYDPMAAWAEEVGLERNHLSVLASDVGAIGWFGMGRIIDTEGLTLPLEDIGVDGAQADLIREHSPDYLLITAVRTKLRILREQEDICRDYYPVRRFSAWGETELEPQLSELSRRWVPDYIVYRRR